MFISLVFNKNIYLLNVLEVDDSCMDIGVLQGKTRAAVDRMLRTRIVNHSTVALLNDAILFLQAAEKICVTYFLWRSARYRFL